MRLIDLYETDYRSFKNVFGKLDHDGFFAGLKSMKDLELKSLRQRIEREMQPSDRRSELLLDIDDERTRREKIGK